MPQIVYWRRDLPPLSEQVEGTHEIEAESPHVPYDIGRRSQMWAECYGPLQQQAEERVRQEVTRLGGSCAHIVDETISAKTDDGALLFWLHGRFQFVMYVHPSASDPPSQSQ